MSERPVKLGRKPIVASLAHHWAVQVGDHYWYEIGDPKAHGKKEKVAFIARSLGFTSLGGAGSGGGEYVGKTNKSDGEIEFFNTRWTEKNPTYEVFTTNCQKYAIEFIRWLTNNNYLLRHEPNAAWVRDEEVANTITFNHDGQAFASAHVAEKHGSKGPVKVHAKLLSAEAEAINGKHGFGAWANASAARLESNVGPVGAHVDLNVNTGVGVRGGNLDVHALGFGGRVGADGVSIDTPIGGVSTTCNVM